MIPAPTILIVDDEKLNRHLLIELLRSECRIILAKNGTQALKLAQEQRPDLILLDVLMPDADGYEVIRTLKGDDRTREIPVIFITALDSVEDEEKGLELGAVDYISKPFRPSIVQARIRNQLQLVHQRHLLERLALIDSLTEIPNRRRFTQVLENEWRRCQRHGIPLSLGVIDVDNFKAYNDSRGHAAGDVVLRNIAGALHDSLKRASDFVARYGGEEFVFLLPELDGVAGRSLAEQMCRDVEALHIPHGSSVTSDWVTISIGGATWIPVTSAPQLDLFNSADSQLYDAKQAGRNRVCWADELASANGGCTQGNATAEPGPEDMAVSKRQSAGIRLKSFLFNHSNVEETDSPGSQNGGTCLPRA